MTAPVPTRFQVFIGPIWKPKTAQCAWDWSVNPPDQLMNNTGALITSITSASATVTVDFGTGKAYVPYAGGLWLGPNGTGQGWEYIGYNSQAADTYNTFSSLQRESSETREHNGSHTAGAAAHIWAPLRTNNGQLHITDEMDTNLASSAWTAELSGVLAPRGFIRANHAIYVRATYVDAGTYSPLLLGWIEEFQIEDDSSRNARWTLRINSIAGILNRLACPPIRIGSLDIARSGKVIKTAPILPHAVKERTSGDYTAAVPDLTPNSLIDGQGLDTVCIWERTLGPDGRNNERESALMGNHFIGQGIITYSSETGPGYRWVQIYTTNEGGGATLWKPMFALSQRTDAAFAAGLQGEAAPSSRILAVENLNLFFAMYPLADPTRIFEIGSTFFDTINVDPAEGDIIGIGNINLGGYQGWPIAFGPDSDDYCEWSHSGTDEVEERWGNRGLGNIPLPSGYQVFRWMYDSESEPYAPEMFQLFDGPDTAGYANPDEPWVLIQLPGMGLRLGADLSTSYTGVLEIADGSAASTNGLPDAGTIQIGGEQLTYTSKTSTTITITARGAGGTDAAEHLAEDPVYIVENGQATDAYLITDIIWRRPEGANAPKDFRIYVGNTLVQPRTPEDTHYTLDYHSFVGVADWAGNEYDWVLSATTSYRRVRWILVEVTAMQTEPARARLNALEAWVDTTVFDPDQWLPDETTIGEAYLHILDLLGVPNDVVTDDTTSTDEFVLQTGEKPAWPVLADIADYTNTLIRVSWMSRITIEDNKIWRPDLTGSGSYSDPAQIFTRASLAGIRHIQERIGAVSQLRLTWLNADGTEGGSISYPSTADEFGQVQDLKAAIYPDAESAAAALARRYLVLKYPTSLAVQLAQGQWDLKTGIFFGVSWSTHDGSDLNRIGCAIAIDTVLEHQDWTSALTLLVTPLAANDLEETSLPDGMALWFKADAITGYSDNASLPTWNDESGNGRNASQSNASYQPKYRIDKVNGKPAVTFNGLTQVMFFDNSWFNVGDGTSFVMARYTATSAERIGFSLSDNAVGNQRWYSPRINGGNFIPRYGADAGTAFGAADTNWHIFRLRAASGESTSYYRDAVLKGTTTRQTGITTRSGAIGASPTNNRPSTTANYYAAIEIAEIIVYPTGLSASDIERVEAYLAEKYALTL